MCETNNADINGDMQESAMNVGKKNIMIVNKFISHPEITSQEQNTAEPIYRTEKIELPVVVMAMTYEEVIQLKDLKSLKKEFDLKRTAFDYTKTYMKNILSDRESDLLSHYGQHREDWKPCNYSPYYSFRQQPSEESKSDQHCFQCTIEQIIKQMLNNFCQHNSLYIEPFFISSNLFDQNKERYDEAKTMINRSGGILIVDAVSLFHPKLYDKLLNSGLILNPKLSILIFYPLSQVNLERNILTEKMFRLNMDCIFDRLSDDNSLPTGFGINDLRGFQQLLFSALHKLNEGDKRISKSNKRKMEQKSPTQPTNIYETFSGAR